MANVKISQLPSYTGTAADSRWFVMNDSGELQTFKYLGYATPFKFITNGTRIQNVYDASSIVASDYSMVLGGGGGSAVQASGANFCGVINSNNSQITTKQNGKGYGTIIVGSNNSIIGGGSDTTSNYGPGIYSTTTAENNAYFSAIIGSVFDPVSTGIGSIIRYGADPNNGIAGSVIAAGAANTIEGLGDRSFIGGGLRNNVQQRYSSIVGGTDNKISDSGSSISTAYVNSGIFAGSNNTIIQSNNCTIAGGTNNTISGNVSKSAVLGGQYGVINQANFAAIVGGYDNNISGATNYSSIIGGYVNVNQGNFSGIFSSRLCSILDTTTEYSTIIGSYSSKTSNDNAHVFGGLQNEVYAQQAGIVLGAGNKIESGCDNSEMLGCRNSLINASSQDVTFVNTINTTSGGYNKITMLSTSGRTATTNNATFVENLVVFNYASLNYADDTAAAAGGVVLGQVYHNNGALRIRIV
jgi:hypothetical protein